MATEGYWADPVIERDRARVYWPTLDAMISQRDPVRLLDEVLQGVDWAPWESPCHGLHRGQPPIHPKHLAGVLLYGLYRGIRSTRKLEEACCYRLDFQWLVEGRHIDHTTLSKFRTKHRDALKDLFRQIGRIAMSLGLISLGEVAFDGTRVKANNSRYGTRTAKTLEAKLQALDELFDRLMEQHERQDSQDMGLGSPTALPESLADLAERRDRIAAALESARSADEARRQQGVNPEKNPAQIPITDPESKVMSNKEGGYAPNYTPVVTTDGKCGLIVDVDVLAEVNESSAAVAAVDRIEATFEKKPARFLTDGGNNSGQVMHQMEQREVEFFAPVESQLPQPGDPAFREDPRQAVASSQWGNLKRNPQGQIDKSCFLYVSEEDRYYCPMGQAMACDKRKSQIRGGVRVHLRVYRCEASGNCPLAAACLSKQSPGARTISRDEYEEVRERTAARMSTSEGRKVYRQRPRIAETPFAILKAIMGLRQFLLRGLEKVKIEFLWAATAFNIMKLLRAIGTMRAEATARA